MKERPILFSAPMVRAILEGRKTQTRRAIRKQFAPDAEPAEVASTSPEGWQISGHSGLWWDDAGACIDDAIRCPYGQPGDRLWVRETWQGPLLGTAGDYKAFNAGGQKAIQKPECCVYRATDTLNAVDDDGKELGWRPSIHMPRWASRILLEIVSVRVERLQDISEADAIAEGIERVGEGWQRFHCDPDAPVGQPFTMNPVLAYRGLWESINGPSSWDANPWVWIVEFKRVTP